ncbi:MAG: c-type cytochrome [Planctomycetota bacterium]|jgi:cbb3-type cytochrome oxidase cytochrome c subunit
MKKSFLFAVLGIGIMVSFALLLLEERNREWKKYQREFQAMEMEMIKKEIQNAGNEKERQRLRRSREDLKKSDVKINQIYIRDLAVTDRCQSCHLRMADQRMAGAAQPFTAHTAPILSTHPPLKFGCTTCHQGQGPATSTQKGHGYEANWKDPLLPLDYIEASCNQCHADLTFRQAPLLSRGKYLIERLGCLGCHGAAVMKNTEKIGPVLDRIKFKVRSAWTARFLKEPRDYSPETRMPNFAFTDGEIRQINDFLIALGGEEKQNSMQKASETAWPQVAVQEMENGRQQISELGCNTCHTISGIEDAGFFKVNKIDPELSMVGSKLNPQWLQRYLRNPSAYQSRSRMSTYRLNDKEITELTGFLAGLQWKKDITTQETRKEPAPLQSGTDSVESGKRVIIRSNCLGCHEIKNIKEGERGPAWDGIASRPIRKFDFGNNPDKLERSKSAWIKAKILKPRSFRDSLKMPLLDILQKDAESITAVLLSLTDKKIPKNYLRKAKVPADLGGRVPLKGPIGDLWQDLKCLQCHSIGGEGGDIGPELAFEGSRVNRNWLRQYLLKPETIRPISAARMPDLKLTEQEASLLSDFIQMSLIENRLPRDKIVEGNISKKSLKRGRKLFSRKYGCIGCHQIDGKGGKIGPDLSKLGQRLKADWLFAYLNNPQSAIPDAMMPNFALTDAQLIRLTEYLLSLGAAESEKTKISHQPAEMVAGGK